MDGFERPQDAVRASIEMIEEMSRFNRTAPRPAGPQGRCPQGSGDCGDAQRPDRLFRTGREYRVRGLTDVN